MKQIKNIAFDLGGVVIALSYEQAVKRFEEIGLKNARQHLDAFHQQGIFGDLESGAITTEEFRIELGKLIGIEARLCGACATEESADAAEVAPTGI